MRERLAKQEAIARDIKSWREQVKDSIAVLRAQALRLKL